MNETRNISTGTRAVVTRVMKRPSTAMVEVPGARWWARSDRYLQRRLSVYLLPILSCVSETFLLLCCLLCIPNDVQNGEHEGHHGDHHEGDPAVRHHAVRQRVQLLRPLAAGAGGGTTQARAVTNISRPG